MTNWLEPPAIQPSPELQAAVGGHPLVAAIMARRGIITPSEALAFLHPNHYTPTPPEAMPGVEDSASRLWQAIQDEKRILIWGDFDVDGQTATSLLVDALRGLGADVIYHIPHRMRDGHGVFEKPLKKLIEEEGVNVLLTCDVGISGHDAIHMAGVLGVTTLITDHHALPPTLPEADAIVNPQLLPDGHALRDLPGVGVAYKLVQHLYKLAGKEGDAARYLDLVALGIVADVAQQKADTRYLLQLGLEKLRDLERFGIQALVEVAGIDPQNFSAEHIGFQIGPRLNALGRLSDANRAVDLLTTFDLGYARILANEMDGLNKQRRQISDQIYSAATEMIAQDPSVEDFEALVLWHPEWHRGVIGIVASRLVELFNKPVVLLQSPEGEPARGSARSVPGVDIGACIAAQADLLIHYGGHPGAAGLGIDADLLPQFRRCLSNTIAETRTDDVAGIQIDAEVTLGELSTELVDDLDRLSPFGAGNPALKFVARDVHVAYEALIGLTKRHRRLVLEDDSGAQQQVIWWNSADFDVPHGQFDALFTPRINDYRGERKLQLEWIDARVTAREVVDLQAELSVTDLRAASDPLAALREALGGDPASIWAEGVENDAADALAALGEVGTRATLSASPTLVIWTAPPGPNELKHELEWPARVVVVGQPGPADTPSAFLQRLWGLVQYALKQYDGVVSLTTLAGATGQRKATIRRGLDWLAAKGRVSIMEWTEDGNVKVEAGGAENPAVLDELETAIRGLLNEAEAYRSHFRRAPLDKLIER